MPETMGSGVAVLDADGDGRIDLLFVNGRWTGRATRRRAQQPTLALYRNERNGAGGPPLRERTKEAGLAIFYGMGVAVGDVNDDGATTS